MSVPRTPTTTVRAVSLRPSSMVAPERDIVRGLQEHVHTRGLKDCGLALTRLPERCSVAIDLLRKQTNPRRTFACAIEFLLGWGTAALLDRPEIKSIKRSREKVLTSDDAEALKRFKWEYHVATDQRGVRDRFANSVHEKVQDRVRGLVGTLGVDQRVVIAHTLQSMLMEAACLPDSLKQQMADELRQFLVAVRHRATELEQVAAGVTRAPVTDLRFSLDDM